MLNLRAFCELITDISFNGISFLNLIPANIYILIHTNLSRISWVRKFWMRPFGFYYNILGWGTSKQLMIEELCMENLVGIWTSTPTNSFRSENSIQLNACRSFLYRKNIFTNISRRVLRVHYPIDSHSYTVRISGAGRSDPIIIQHAPFELIMQHLPNRYTGRVSSIRTIL